AAQHRRKVPARLPEVHPLGPQLVAVEDDLSLRLVELQVRVGEHEDAALKRFADEGVGELRQALRLGGRGGDEVHRATAAPWRGWGDRGSAGAAGGRRGPAGALDWERRRVLLSRAPGLGALPSDPAVGRRDLEDALGFREGPIDVVDLLGEELGLVDG